MFKYLELKLGMKSKILLDQTFGKRVSFSEQAETSWDWVVPSLGQSEFSYLLSNFNMVPILYETVVFQ